MNPWYATSSGAVLLRNPSAFVSRHKLTGHDRDGAICGRDLGLIIESRALSNIILLLSCILARGDDSASAVGTRRWLTADLCARVVVTRGQRPPLIGRPSATTISPQLIEICTLASYQNSQALSARGHGAGHLDSAFPLTRSCALTALAANRNQVGLGAPLRGDSAVR